MSWRFNRKTDRMLGHDFPGVCGNGMDDFTRDELELGARVALELASDDQAWDALDGALWEAGQHPMDRGRCRYFAYNMGKAEFATCSFSCREEPSCITGEPEGGWPSARLAGLYEGT